MQTGKIGVTTENIFPIIKKFLYSEHEIFLRELISNAVDATQKLKTLASAGEYKEEIGELKIRVSLDKKKKTLTVSDNGIGMTGEEIKKYINQIAFSSAEEFLEKYKNQSNAIIGHFGLGFYSSFMVSDKVEIKTKSYKKGSKAVHWSCDGSPEYTLDDLERDETGTEVILHLDKDSKEFLEESRIEQMLKRYCRFLPVEIAFGKEKEWKEDKYVETDKDRIINETKPLWTRKPVDLKEEDYTAFYQDLYPMSEEPLFNIHLNVDYPFNLTGILYFPRIKSNIEVQKKQDPALLQPGLRNGLGRRDRPRIPDPAARGARFPRYPAECLAELPAGGPQCQEDLEPYYQKGRRPSRGNIQERTAGIREEMGRLETVHQLRHDDGGKVLRTCAEVCLDEEHRRKIFHLRGIRKTDQTGANR
jgi:HSP90 family molecular chaperone